MAFRQEFQAVVLAAGKGSRIQELTAEKPKCLLPVGNKPLVWYPLYKLQQSGFQDVLLIVLEDQRNEIQTTLDKSDLDIKIEYFTIPEDEDLGTADSLRLVYNKILSDVIILSCDLVSDIKLKDVLDLFRKHDATVASLLIKPEQSQQLSVPGPKVKHKPERDLIGVDAQTNRLVFLASASDFESEVQLSKRLIKKHPHIIMYSSLIDCHLYVIKKWVIDYMMKMPNISTIKGELLPHVVKKQLSKPSKSKSTDKAGSSSKEDIFSYVQESDLTRLIRESSSYNDHTGDMKPCYHGDSIRCYAYIASPETYGVRVNTLHGYWSVNSKIVDKWDKISNGKELIKIDPKAEVKSNQIDEKCLVWDMCKLNEKTSFKSSIIGSNTEVHSFSRAFNCVIMNNVTIKEKVALENCIVCDDAVIESGSKLVNCLIGSHHVVPEDSAHTNEVLTKSDRLMEF